MKSKILKAEICRIDIDFVAHVMVIVLTELFLSLQTLKAELFRPRHCPNIFPVSDQSHPQIDETARYQRLWQKMELMNWYARGCAIPCLVECLCLDFQWDSRLAFHLVEFQNSGLLNNLFHDRL